MAYRSDLTVPIPEQAVTNADNVGNFGIDGPNVPYVDWQPRGDGEGQAPPSRFLRGGRAPKKIGSIALKSIDFIQVSFMCPPYGDESEKYVKPEMLAFIVKEFDSETGAHTALTLSKCNQIMFEAHKEFRAYRDAANPAHDKDCADFWEYLREFGEKMLETYHQARKNMVLWNAMTNPDTGVSADKLAKLKRYYELSTQDLFCWLTAFGIKQKIEFLGSVINTNRPEGDVDDPTDSQDHFSVVNACMAKRARIANVFGPADRITTGSKLWITLRRKAVLEGGQTVYNEFQLVPGGSTTHDYPTQREASYIDPSGRSMTPTRYHVGVVNFPGAFSPTRDAMEIAANISSTCSEVRAYNEHAGLPSLIVSLSVKQ